MLNTMYRLAVFFIAAVFIFNSAASLAWIDLPVDLAMTSGDHHGAMATERRAVDHQDTHSHKVAGLIGAAQDHGQSVNHADKCCVACIVANVVPDAVVTAVTFSSVTVVFHAEQDDLAGHLAARDPDIPKSLV